MSFFADEMSIDAPGALLLGKKRCIKSRGALSASRSRQFEHPERRASIGRIPDLRHERRERRGLRATVAGHQRDVLPSVDKVRDRRRARHVVQACVPELTSGRIVIRRESPVDGTGEDDAARGREHARGHRRSLTRHPQRFLRLNVDGVDAPVLAVAVRPWPQRPAHARRQAAASAGRDRQQIHARFDQRHEQDMTVGVVGVRQPALQSARVRTRHDGFAVAGRQTRVNLFGAGLRIDAGDDVLHAEIEREGVLALLRVEIVVDGLLAAGADEQTAARRQPDQHASERPVVVPLIVREMLVMPLQLAGVRVNRQRRVREQQIVVRPGGRIAVRPGVIRLADADVEQPGG